jgi:ferredoxin like protein
MSQTTITDKLYTIRFKCDTVSHLTIKDQEVCQACLEKSCNYFCPADVYEWDPKQKITMVAFENCIECGTCRIACPANNIKWLYPTGGYGISYKMG